MIKNELEKILGFELTATDNSAFGDYTANIAMVKAKKEGKNPREYATQIADKLKANGELSEFVEKIEVAGPGFINFWIKSDALVSNLIQIGKQKEKYGRSDSLKNKKIMFEYGDANTHKLPHIGHLYSYTYGESVTRILDFAGATVRKACYQGDIGLHVAKCLWAYKRENPKVPESLKDKAELLQKMYQTGSAAFDDDPKAKEEITALNKAIYDQGKSIKDLWLKTRSWSVDYYKKFEEELNVSYDRYYYESEVYKKGQEIVESNVGPVFTKSEGAIIFEGSKYGLHDRVFVTKYGTPTYEAKDMYLQELKMKEWPMDLLIITTAYEQNGYFDVIFKALETLHPEYKGKLLHLGFGMINLKSGKMSSRTGEIIGAIDLIDQVKEAVKEFNKDEKVAEDVAVASIKYSFLKNGYEQNVAFDIKESISNEGNSGPYLQYTVARCNSVINKSGYKDGELGVDIKNNAFGEAETTILRTLMHFDEVVASAAASYSPNLLCNFLYDLAQKFNSFYNSNRILSAPRANSSTFLETAETTKKSASVDHALPLETEKFRVALTYAVAQVLKNGLNLLGIKTPEKM